LGYETNIASRIAGSNLQELLLDIAIESLHTWIDLLSQNINSFKGSIQVPGLAVGLYEVKLFLENGETSVVKMVKQ